MTDKIKEALVPIRGKRISENVAKRIKSGEKVKFTISGKLTRIWSEYNGTDQEFVAEV